MAGKNKKNSMIGSSTFKGIAIFVLAVSFVWIILRINGDYGLASIEEENSVPLAGIESEPKFDEGQMTQQLTTQVESTTEVVTKAQPETTVKPQETTTKATESTTSTTEKTTEKTTETTTIATTEEDAKTQEETDQKSDDIVKEKLGDYEKYENRAISWSYKRNKEHKPVEGYSEGVDINKFGAKYIGDTSKKVVYLTFDEGYENGYTSKILDILSANKVRATFFVTKAYVDGHNGYKYVARMKREGHFVANHSATHPDMTTKTPKEFIDEIESTRKSMEEKSGYKMDMFFRPPQGKFSERTLYFTKKLGYKTIFWSMAHRDWLIDDQPGRDVSYEHVVTNVHPGAIILLHAVSKSNTEALDDIIKELKAMGYEFGSLYDLY